MALNNPSAADDAPKLMQVRAEIAEAAAQLGFEYFVHGMRWPLPITQPRTSFFSNYPPAWEQRYREQGYLLIDPTVAHGMRSSAPVVWSDAFFAQTPQLWQEAQAQAGYHPTVVLPPPPVSAGRAPSVTNQAFAGPPVYQPALLPSKLQKSPAQENPPLLLTFTVKSVQYT